MYADDLWRSGRSLLHVHTEENNARARALFVEAIRLEPGFARAYGHLSYTYVRAYMYGWDPQPGDAQAMALRLAERALQLDPADYDNHWSMGVALLWNDRHDEAVAAYEEAMAKNAHDPDLLASMGDALVAVGRSSQAVDQIQRALKLNPEPPAWYRWNLGFAHLMRKDHESAIRDLLPTTGRLNAARLHLAASYALRDRAADASLGDPGDKARAAQEVKELLQREPQWSVALAKRQPLKDAADQKHLEAGLRTAGLK